MRSKQHEYLVKHGWTCLSQTRRGMHLIKRWHKVGVGVMGQADAITRQRAALKYEKQQKAAAQLPLIDQLAQSLEAHGQPQA